MKLLIISSFYDPFKACYNPNVNVSSHLTGRQIWAGTVQTQLEASKDPSLQAWSSAKPAGKAPTGKAERCA